MKKLAELLTCSFLLTSCASVGQEKVTNYEPKIGDNINNLYNTLGKPTIVNKYHSGYTIYSWSHGSCNLLSTCKSEVLSVIEYQNKKGFVEDFNIYNQVDGKVIKNTNPDFFRKYSFDKLKEVVEISEPTKSDQLRINYFIQNNLKDPESAKLKNVRVVKNKLTNKEYICGLINGKNSYGGYTGFEPFGGMASLAIGSEKLPEECHVD